MHSTAPVHLLEFESASPNKIWKSIEASVGKVGASYWLVDKYTLIDI